MKSVSRLFSLVILAAILPPMGLPAARAQFPEFAPSLEMSTNVQLDEADNAARSRLEQIDRFLADGQSDEAIEGLRSLMDRDGDKLIPLKPRERNDRDTFARYVPLRDYIHRRLAMLQRTRPEALQLYRDRVDPLAATWYRQAVGARDASQLRRLVDRMFCSSYGDQALFELGAIELDRGNFSWARNAWERIHPALRWSSTFEAAANVGPGYPLGILLRGRPLDAYWLELEAGLSEPPLSLDWLAYPDTDLDAATLRARLALVSILERSPQRAEIELDLLRRLAPGLTGPLAGVDGEYEPSLRRLLEESTQWPPSASRVDWTTFGGSNDRGKIALATVDAAQQPLWTLPLPPQPAFNDLAAVDLRVGEDDRALLSYHPLVVDDAVLVATGGMIDDVQAYGLHDGRPLWPPVARQAEAEDLQAALMKVSGLPGQIGVPRYTMTATDDLLLVKLGPQATTVPTLDRDAPPPSGYLAALDLVAQKKLLYSIQLDAGQWGAGWAFEGPPVSDGDRLYTALRRRDNLRAQAHIACFDIKRGKLLWQRLVASAETLGQGQRVEHTHNLLSLDQGVLYLNTNLGAVAAVRADDGQILWVMRYPRTPPDPDDLDRCYRYLLRDLNPCVIHKDVVIVAPGDCDRIFALDATSGILLWSLPPQVAVDVVHLLGVGRNHLIATGNRVYWIDVYSGQVKAQFPARVDDTLRGYGRGLLAGDHILWPTRQRIFVFGQSGLRQARQPIDLSRMGITGGNLVIADGILLIAGASQLAAFDPYGPRAAPDAQEVND